jgi:hypothetical protein
MAFLSGFPKRKLQHTMAKSDWLTKAAPNPRNRQGRPGTTPGAQTTDMHIFKKLTETAGFLT